VAVLGRFRTAAQLDAGPPTGEPMTGRSADAPIAGQLPQPLEYMITDAASRKVGSGCARVGGTVLRADDSACWPELRRRTDRFVRYS